ncbi:MAG: type II toxin-antitoxin system PemK/MazF family toxin [Microbacteriaceae bacterium]|nr:MAG: type II toxin-antitoxin system PemK/MazF family toxin [Microbacteriaceae bacterium]
MQEEQRHDGPPARPHRWLGSSRYGLRSHVALEPEHSGLEHISYARCDQLRLVSVERLTSRRGLIGPGSMQDIDQSLRFVLDL